LATFVLAESVATALQQLLCIQWCTLGYRKGTWLHHLCSLQKNDGYRDMASWHCKHTTPDSECKHKTRRHIHKGTCHHLAAVRQQTWWQLLCISYRKWATWSGATGRMLTISCVTGNYDTPEWKLTMAPDTANHPLPPSSIRNTHLQVCLV